MVIEVRVVVVVVVVVVVEQKEFLEYIIWRNPQQTTWQCNDWSR